MKKKYKKSKKQKKSWNMWFRRSINISIPLKKCICTAHRTAAKSMVYINDIFKYAHFPAHRAYLVHSFTLTITYSWINNCHFFHLNIKIILEYIHFIKKLTFMGCPKIYYSINWIIIIKRLTILKSIFDFFNTI